MLLKVRDINHQYGHTSASQVLFDVNFSLEKGEVLGFLGPNGAGKSTTMRILTGYLRPTSGTVLFDGKDISRKPKQLRNSLGYLPEHVPLYPGLRVAEYLRWVAAIKKSSHPIRQVVEALDRCGLRNVQNTLIRHLSKGYRQRVGLAQAIVGDTRLLVLDEPTTGLDPAQIREIRELIRELGQEKTILLSTHIMQEVELTCDRMLILNQGRIVAQGTPQEIRRNGPAGGRYLLRLSDALDGVVIAAYESLEWVRSVAPVVGERDAWIIETDPAHECREAISRLAVEKRWPILEFRPVDFSLEEAFMDIVQANTPDDGFSFVADSSQEEADA